MGARKHTRAEERKEARKTQYLASLQNVPTSPRKMRLVADMIRGKNVEIALYALKFSPKEASNRLYKLLRSAIANWEAKNEGARVDYSTLYVKDVFVDSGRVLKRVLPAPQGRAHRIRKRSNHVTMVLDSKPSTQE
jgi:large subunit ribosomal protein L22